MKDLTPAVRRRIAKNLRRLADELDPSHAPIRAAPKVTEEHKAKARAALERLGFFHR
jgi:hypothetical protein